VGWLPCERSHFFRSHFLFLPSFQIVTSGSLLVLLRDLFLVVGFVVYGF